MYRKQNKPAQKPPVGWPYSDPPAKFKQKVLTPDQREVDAVIEKLENESSTWSTPWTCVR